MGSGRRTAAGAAGAMGEVAPSTGVQVSKSLVVNVLPHWLRANRRPPSAENQTCSTGPVAGEASIHSTAEVPTLRQSGPPSPAAPTTAISPSARIGAWDRDVPF